MKNKLLMTTTPTLEGVEIEQYLGLVAANQVTGTGFISDSIASLSDFFGGRSGTYRNQMESLYEEVLDTISKRTIAMGGNAIIGVSVDYDSISAKNMSMFMVSIKGTAVKIKEEQANQSTEHTVGEVPYDVLECACMEKAIYQDLANDIPVSDNTWKYILSHNMPSIAPALLAYYLQMREAVECSERDACLHNFGIFFSTLSYEQGVELAYGETVLPDLIKEYRLFSPSRTLQLILEGKAQTAISTLSADKPSYNTEDLTQMQAILAAIDNLPDYGQMAEVKGGLFTSGGMKFICACGTKNECGQEFCGSCGRDIKGLTMPQRKAIQRFRTKTKTLAEVLR